MNKNGVIVFTDDSRHGKHSHTVYNADGTQRGHRDEGHGKDFQRDDLSQTSCDRCGDYFDYPSRWENTPKFCRDCVEIIRAERSEREKRKEEDQSRQRKDAKSKKHPDINKLKPLGWGDTSQDMSQEFDSLK